MRQRVYNRPHHRVLLAALIRHGWTNAHAARQLGVAQGVFGDWVNLRAVPTHVTDAQERVLLELTGRTFDELWPPETRVGAKGLLLRKQAQAALQSATESLLRAKNLLEEPAENTEEPYAAHALAATIRRTLATLTPREEKVLRMRYGIGEKYDYTPEEVAADFEVPRERIRQIEAKALRKLRHPSRSKKLREYAIP